MKHYNEHLNILADCENGVWINRNKVAKKSWGSAWFVENPVTKLRQCERCKNWSTPKKIQYRYCCGFNYLCMGCWNKLKPVEAYIYKQYLLMFELKELLIDLKRAIRERKR